MLVYEAWETPPTPRPSYVSFKTDVLIATYDEDIEIVEPTLIGALKIRGDTKIWLCDDGNRAEMRALAARYGVEYQIREDNSHAKAGNINAVLPKLTGELTLILDADHVPSPDVLEAMSGYFVDPKVALAQSAHSFRNHNSVMHEETGRHEQSLFFDVLLPGRNRLGSVFWCGSAALIRISALREVGGVATKTSTEDFETTLLLQMKGYRTQYHNEHLIQGLAPDNLDAYIIQRARWAQGTLSAFRPGYALPLSRKLTIRQRISYAGAFMYYITPLQRMVYTSYVILVGLFGLVPVAQVGPYYLSIWGIYIVTTLTAVAALERGSTQPFEGMRNTFLSLEPFLKALPVLFSKKPLGFKVTPKNGVDLGGWKALSYIKLPLIIISINAIVITLRWGDHVSGYVFGLSFLPEQTVFASFAVTGFGILEVIIIGLLARKLYKRRQYRKLWRFPVRLTGTLNSVPINVVDLHQGGMAAYVSADAFSSEGLSKLSLDIEDLDGETVTVHGLFTPRNVRRLRANNDGLRVGGEIIWSDPISRTKVMEYCYVAEPYRARNKHWTRRSPRVQVLFKGTVDSLPATAIDISIGGVGFYVSTAIGFEPGTVVPTEIRVKSETIRGTLTVRYSKEISQNNYRVGGEVRWDRTDWLNDIVKYEHVAKRSQGIHAFRR